MKMSNYAKEMFSKKPITFNAKIATKKVLVASENKGICFSEAEVDSVEGRYMLVTSSNYWVIIYTNQDYNEVVESANKDEFSSRYKPQRWFLDIIKKHNEA